MKILHLCLTGVYTDAYSYQENMLVKYHRRLGYEIEVVAPDLVYDSTGNLVPYAGERRYTDPDGAVITRLKTKQPKKLYRILRRFEGLGACLDESRADVLFIHGCQFLDMDVVVKYLKKHPDVTVYVDNHADFNNSAKNFLSKNILHKGVWKHCARIIEPYTSKFYGVVPARVDFLTEAYGLPKEKCALLELGADDSAVERASKPEVRRKRRAEYGVSDDDIVIVTGGKIDRNKPQVLTLMKAVNQIGDKRIKLMIFGSVIDELKEEFEQNLSDAVLSIGWRRSDDIYEDFAAADLAAFPGLHSVLWEQAVGMGKPCVFRRIKGFDHIDLGGNCLFFEDDSVEAYAAVIRKAVESIDAMKAVAEEKGRTVFSYREIAKRALEG